MLFKDFPKKIYEYNIHIPYYLCQFIAKCIFLRNPIPLFYSKVITLSVSNGILSFFLLLLILRYCMSLWSFLLLNLSCSRGYILLSTLMNNLIYVMLLYFCLYDLAHRLSPFYLCMNYQTLGPYLMGFWTVIIALCKRLINLNS